MKRKVWLGFWEGNSIERKSGILIARFWEAVYSCLPLMTPRPLSLYTLSSEIYVGILNERGEAITGMTRCSRSSSAGVTTLRPKEPD